MTAKHTAAALPSSRETRDLRRLFSDTEIRVFLPTNAQEGGVFRARKGPPELLRRVTALTVDTMAEEGTLLAVRTTSTGRLYRGVPIGQRRKPPRTAQDRRSAPWLAAERVFSSGPDHKKQTISVNLAESPIGWLARRRDSSGKPFLSRDEVAAGERLRADFERAQLGPSVSQDWKQFLTAGVTGGTRMSPQERNMDNSESAARRRLFDALDALGPGLSDVALRVCCFLEGIEAVEGAMHWSARSGKVVLKIALQRLAQFYEAASVRTASSIEAWHAPNGDGSQESAL